MLCDLAVNDRKLRTIFHGFEHTQEKIRRAQKFILDSHFSIACDGLVDNSGELLKAVPFCKLPYPLTWIELAHKDRSHFTAVDLKPDQYPVSRVGYLLQQQDDTAFTAFLFWNLSHMANDINASLIKVAYDTEGFDFDSAIEWRHREDASPEDIELNKYFRPLMVSEYAGNLLQNSTVDSIRELLIHCSQDWGGETRFLIAVLGLMNTRNASAIDSIDHTHFNRKRAKHGRTPLFSYSLLKIHPLRLRQGRVGEGRAGAEAMRAHFVRGHFKQRRSGLFWWNSFVRGDIDRGWASKDYNVD